MWLVKYYEPFGQKVEDLFSFFWELNLMQIVAGRFEKNIFSNSALFGLVIKVTPYELTDGTFR